MKAFELSKRSSKEVSRNEGNDQDGIAPGTLREACLRVGPQGEKLQQYQGETNPTMAPGVAAGVSGL